MLKNLFLLTLYFISTLCIGQPEKKFGETFIQSIAKNNFGLLNPYLFNSTTAKSDREFAKMNPAKQAATLGKYRNEVNEKWKKALTNARNNRIDFKAVRLKEVYTKPLSNNMHSMLVTWLYNGREWDDLLFIVEKKGPRITIIEMPLNTAMFSMNDDTRGKNSNEFSGQNITAAKLQEKLSAAVNQLKVYSQGNDSGALFRLIVYSGEEDKEGRWKRPVDPSKEEDRKSAQRVLPKLNKIFFDCNDGKYGNVSTEKESEGTWYILPYICPGKTYRFAFLKIGDDFLLGDID